jgi:hypothetical protein
VEGPSCSLLPSRGLTGRPACEITNDRTHASSTTLQAAVATLTGMDAGRVLRINAGTTTVRRLTITGGLAGDGGGIEVFPTGTPTVTGSVVRNNAAGGGVHDRSGVYDVSALTGSVSGNLPDQCFPAVPALNC